VLRSTCGAIVEAKAKGQRPARARSQLVRDISDKPQQFGDFKTHPVGKRVALLAGMLALPFAILAQTTPPSTSTAKITLTVDGQPLGRITSVRGFT
jgi:hypothetical protein